MEKKVILILEDRDDERDTLHGALKDRNFDVVSAASAEEARVLARQLGVRMDVLLLDMQIDQPDLQLDRLVTGSEAETTGADFGLEVKEQLKAWPPEFLIHSVYGLERYYQLAFRLGAAKYLRKPVPLAELVRHVRVLALRRALFPARPNLEETIEAIAERSRSGSEAITRFCKEVLCPELEATLGAPFVLLVGQGESTVILGSDLGLPESSPAYGWLQTLAHLQAPTDPLVIKSGYVPEGKPEQERASAREVFSRLERAAFIPLGSTGDLRLSLGVVQEERDRPFVEDAVALTKVIGAYIQPALVMHLLGLTRRLAELYTSQRAVLEATSDLCLYVGQEQVAAFGNILSSGRIHGAMPRDLERLLNLGENLRKAGELLSWIGRKDEDGKPAASTKPASMADLVREVWKDILDEFPQPDPGLIAISGDCLVEGKPDDLQIAVGRLLQWLMNRTAETPTGKRPALSVVCRRVPNEKESHVIFEDHSRRLPSNLREKLFSPFATPVPAFTDCLKGGDSGEILGPYLSKVLVEVENKGFLDDCSDELPGDFGHRFVMRFPQPKIMDAPAR
jgi:CheY-like chemotaxis protein